ncbi:phytoene desaturase family protein [Mycetocola zhadangensis]|uniref:Pyridine nucleotide-disulfide oxidoreductase domain-containing protein 2 n=1 Tax=Mycetocola zhadangensis TaxID=1164595 RepID=A0A3L7J3R1_9MICO|nr:NAD(P)/FAD-dependent oxidoreductase [Mycetocola zhadangensis]RLQ84081.1 NAD(P)/FAD-dependent oxidoreductase [Mycetocola zhadangensis]GGE96336.1 phytoene dehydrogenase [Mycetocola zhadangensis]
MSEPEAIIVGAGPNGLAAAVTLARAGVSVRVYERANTIGGGSRTSEVTLPGFRHDTCSAVHPMALASDFFTRFGLTDRIRFALPELSYAQPLDSGRAGLAWHSLDRTVDDLGRDGAAWRQLLEPLVSHANSVAGFVGTSLLRIPEHPITMVRFGLRALEQGSGLWNTRWHDDAAPALLTGVLAHAIRPLPSFAPTAAGLVLATLAHAGGWPVPIGGSQSIVDAMAADVTAHGGEIVTGAEVTHLRELPPARAVLLDTSARGLQQIAGNRLPAGYARRLGRFRYGNAVAKVDFALSGPVPWTNETLHEAGTLHLGGTRAEIARAEQEVARGQHPSNPYVLVSQPSTFDPTRAPEGKHTLWAYTHVPAGSTEDRTEAIIRQIERFAPGFRDLILASTHRSAVEYEEYNPNYVGGDISAGDVNTVQLVARPTLSLNPWRTPLKGVYLCSSSTPPGPGVHGMPGWNAALLALRDEFGVTTPPSLSPLPEQIVER